MLTDVDDSHVHTKGLTGEFGHVSHVVTKITNRHDPMEDGSPYCSPAHEPRIDSDVVYRNDVVYGVVEKRNQTSDADDGYGLSA